MCFCLIIVNYTEENKSLSIFRSLRRVKVGMQIVDLVKSQILL